MTSPSRRVSSGHHLGDDASPTDTGRALGPRPGDHDGDDDRNDWRWQLRHVVTSADELGRHLELTPSEVAGARRAEAAGLPLRITPYFLSLCDPHDPDCPIRRQVVPRADEAAVVTGDLVDPLGEEAHAPVPSLVHRYPDRALLLLSDQCAIHCRFCTRSRMVGGGDGPAGWSELQPAFDYLAQERQIRDVIVSGGDALTVSSARLERLLEQLRAIGHIEIIRLATRALACLPQRVDPALVATLSRFHPLWLMSHFNHPRELSPEAERACSLLVDGGFPIMNQTVLLRGVNDSGPVLEELFRRLVRLRVKPYYLHQMDPVRGSAHLRTPLARGIELMASLQGRLSGIALPTFVVDTPGGHGKVPVGPDYVVARQPGRTTLRAPDGELVDYLDPPP